MLQNISSITAFRTMSRVPLLTLSDGVIIPQLAFGAGTLLAPAITIDLLGTAHYRKECREHILNALHSGFRHLDTAEEYRNEISVREALAEWPGSRDQVFIIAKCTMHINHLLSTDPSAGGEPDPGGSFDPRASLQRSLENVGTTYLLC